MSPITSVINCRFQLGSYTNHRTHPLLTLADELDIKVLTTSLGMSYAGVAHYRPNTSLAKLM
ncbi:hypothetical protein [Streptomyces sp. A3M-1-3]|uniref:hypothetical protein n=1 Tax=Streptomyces sp. A3M-1-3 TaxID=2962044 RepID=UPI0020B63A4A|nr:hypothetical protein [Streptomyces sp. A3M-1-3]